MSLLFSDSQAPISLFPDCDEYGYNCSGAAPPSSHALSSDEHIVATVCNWCEQNIERCRRLIKIGEMTSAGLAVIPDLDPTNFVFEDWAIDAIKEDKEAWQNFQSFPENYRRIKLDRIQHYKNTGRPEQAETALRNFIRDCHNGKMSPNWRTFDSFVCTDAFDLLRKSRATAIEEIKL